MPSAACNSTANEKFKAALNVIEKLPKEGPAKPSHQVMLSFYSLYKQATEGPCTKPKPWAIDVVNKIKWDYWSKLGNMSKEEAMSKYVEALKKQIEDIPNSTDMSDFMEVLGKFYSVAGISPPKSFTDHYDFTSVKTSTSAESFSAIEDHKYTDKQNGEAPTSSTAITSDEEDFCDTSDVFEDEVTTTEVELNGTDQSSQKSSNEALSATTTSYQETSTNDQHHNRQKVYKQIENSLNSLQNNMHILTKRIDDVEKQVAKHEEWRNKLRKRRLAQIFPGLSNESLALIILWPFLVNWLLRLLRKISKKST